MPGGKDFMVIRSDLELDVVTVYTSRASTPNNAGVGASMDVEHIGPKVVEVPPPEPTGDHIWSQRFGDGGFEIAYSAADSAGNILLTGVFTGTIDFGGGSLTAVGFGNGFLAKFDAGGNHIWSKRFGGEAAQVEATAVSDESGNVLITGFFKGTVDFGGGSLTSGGSFDIFVAKFDTNGSHLWSRSFGDASDQRGWDLSTDNQGNVLVTAAFRSTVNFGGGPLQSAGGFDIALAKLDFNGNHLWSKRVGEGHPEWASSVATDLAGNVLIEGAFVDTVDLGGGPLASAGSFDIFLAKLDSGGNHMRKPYLEQTIW